MAKIGENIRKIRLINELTQNSLAKNAEIAQSFLSNIENGLQSPNIKNLQKIARALNVPLEMLIK